LKNERQSYCYCRRLSDIENTLLCLKVHQVSSACPSDDSITKMKIMRALVLKYWQARHRYSDKSLSEYHFVKQKSHSRELT
jgi:hypothetical protein